MPSRGRPAALTDHLHDTTSSITTANVHEGLRQIQLSYGTSSTHRKLPPLSSLTKVSLGARSSRYLFSSRPKLSLIVPSPAPPPSRPNLFFRQYAGILPLPVCWMLSLILGGVGRPRRGMQSVEHQCWGISCVLFARMADGYDAGQVVGSSRETGQRLQVPMVICTADTRWRRCGLY